ncbi:hypothetical protein R1sor_024164 [Riccia sorocarpa]|uniref:ABC transporter domain-containing protein n=1 Tax=Riccia sorocarpa TaxID=122646 RepID=A0ABD3GPV3_9MARC
MANPVYTSIPSCSSRDYSRESSIQSSQPIYGSREYSRELSLEEALPVEDDDAVVETPMSPIFQYSLSLKQNALEIERRPSRVRTMSAKRAALAAGPEVQLLSGKSSSLQEQRSLQLLQQNGLPKRRAFEICIQNLTYKALMQVRVKEKGQKVKKEKVLLNQVTADARYGEVLAIVGPSGSGKTTLLDALAGRIHRRSLEGTILVNGKPIDSKFKRISGYVTQEDALFPLLTVRETLMFSARLRLPESMASSEKQERVDLVIQQLGLRNCASTKVGNDKIRGISGGERRRVSIGVDLIHDPPVLLLDEPTSGLDSKSAVQVMQYLSMIAKHGRTVVLTIHQPSYAILELIHNTLVLVQGNVVYHGPQAGMVNFYADMGYIMPDHMTVVEYILDSAEKVADRPKGVAKLVEFYNDTRIPTKDEQIVVHPAIDRPVPYATSFFNQTLVLTERSMINVLRTRQHFVARTILLIVGALILGSLFFQAKENEVGVRQRQSFIAFALAFFFFTSGQTLPIMLSERQIFMREADRAAYHTSAYVLSGCLILLPFQFFMALVFSAVAYSMVGLDSSFSAICFFLLFMFLVLAVAQSFVTLVAGVIPDIAAANDLLHAVLSYSFLFSGFFIQRTAIPKYWLWMHYISPFKYPYEALMYNEFSHLKSVVWFNNEDSFDVLSSLALASVRPWRNVGIMTVIWFSCILLFYCALKVNGKLIRH